MTIKIEEAVESKLVMAIAEGLQSTTLRAGDTFGPIHVKWLSELGQMLSDDARTKLVRYCGDSGLTAFVTRYIRSDLLKHYGVGGAISGKLTDKPHFANSIPYARTMIGELKKLPGRYRATLAMPNQFSEAIENDFPSPFKLSENFAVARGSDLPSDLPLSSEYTAVNNILFSAHWMHEELETPTDIEADRLYLTANILGYAGAGEGLTIARDFEDTLKAFFGAAIALKIVQPEFFVDGEDFPLMMIHTEGKDREIVSTERIEQDINDGAAGLSTGQFAHKFRDKIWEELNRRFGMMQVVFQDNPHSRRMFTACIWFYRATVSKRPLDKLLESTIAIETLIGDRKESEGIGLTNLLGNRCAYLLGTNMADRQEIIADFGKVYKLRSSVVHEGKHKLEGGDRAVVATAVRLCGQILGREMSLSLVRNPA